MSQGSALLRPVTLGDLKLPNRVVMAPTTRCRPPELRVLYYARRASAGLIVTEGTLVSDQPVPFPQVPGLFTPEQVAGWRRVTDLVHTLGGRIMVQLWHAGLTPPDAMTPSEIATAVADYRSAAANALRAGFDGVEIAANGTYLIAQSLNPRLNHRTDAYRVGPRLLLDVIDTVLTTGCRVGVRLSPYWCATDSTPACPDYIPDGETLSRYDDVVRELDSLSYLHLRGPAAFELDAFARYRKLFDGFLVANNGFALDSAEAAVESGIADAVSFARHFIANPDLVTRFALDQELSVADRAFNYVGGPVGYV
ncbi:alkene reductase [Kutzneria buriramensis]|uniref:N-ethylmaleimide reductase n=1 Tax=Kutzneria buriramensis TaxID=1045776 RepID=A0A3E0GVC9_9PSEU|nr:alkene reductase [Kutzneria buriramensis]REH29421.1 N-ethylmaleimide reductase [Kutzneria buriramensis]